MDLGEVAEEGAVEAEADLTISIKTKRVKYRLKRGEGEKRRKIDLESLNLDRLRPASVGVSKRNRRLQKWKCHKLKEKL